MPKHVRPEHEGPTIEYPDAKGLTRPQELPRPQLIILGVFVLAAIIIGCILLYNTLDKLYFSANRTKATVEEVISSDIDPMVPYLPISVTQTDEGIRAWMQESGFTTYEMNTDSAGNIIGFDVLKLPKNVTLLEAQLAYTQGLSSIGADEAARLLHGSWRLAIERNGPVSMTLRYADFTSGSIDAAIQAAIASQIPPEAAMGESGVDSMGNTFQAGTLENNIDGITYQWQVSAIALSEVYKVPGLPDNAVYVGIRISQ